MTAECPRMAGDRYRRLVENLPEVVFRYRTTDPVGFEYINPASHRILGHVPAAFRDDAELFFRHTDARDEPALRMALLHPRFNPVIEARYFHPVRGAIMLAFDLVADPDDLTVVEGLIRDVTVERQRDERFVLDQEAITAIDEGILITDPTRVANPIIFCNPAFSRITGYTAVEANGRNCRFLQGPDTDRATVTVLRESIRAGVPMAVEILNYRKDGTPFWNALSISPIRDAEGSVVHYVGVIADITARRQAEANSRTAFNTQTAILNALSAWIALLEPDGTIARVNDHQLFDHISRFPVLGERYPPITLRDGIAPDVVAALIAGVTAVLVGDEPSFELEFPFDLGKNHRWLRVQVTPVVGDDRPAGAVVMHQEVTQRRATEDRLRRTDGILRRAQDLAGFGAFALHWGGGGTDYFTDGLAKIFGSIPRETTSASELLRSVIDSNDRKIVDNAFRQAVETGHAFDFEVPIRRNDGQVRRIRVLGEPEVGAPGSPVRVIGVVQDVTDTRALEEQYRHSQRMEAVSRLAGGVAHDFNNLLTVILGYSRLMLAEMTADHPLRDMIAEIRDAGDRAVGLTHQLLAFSRKQVLQPEPLDVVDHLGGMQKLLARILGEDVELRYEHDGHPARIRADKGQFDQVVLNLLVNARDAMPSGGVVHLRLRGSVPPSDALSLPPSPAGWIGIDVADSGTGIPPETLARIFDPFFTTKDVGKGTGLGLATVYGIVQQSGGRITVASELQKGTTFRILLPGCVDDAADGQIARRIAAPAGSGTVLLVEDQDTVRRLFRSVLESAGYLTIEADSGEEALELAGKYTGRIDVLVTDMLMPRIGGRELAEKLVKTRPSLRVLLVSGYTDDVVVKDGKVPRDWIFLHKPLVPADLVARVNELIATRNAGVVS